ncbi:hypothetical protein OS189_05450 [Sulfitobacter sp. F26169L]|uniref:hypothetical protein n=1 Tax=Sulfitobacter sp. F26169L TaxID=2996015 RepID=UPI0022608D42|nr:hypothetical protein [Sulfitobacter sp. F26169L]MCX7565780.1 hypothetical protein [Sulfitobacter sp. F26169L]
MSNLKNLATMKRLVDIKYRQQQESFGRLTAQEGKLRNSLSRLETQRLDSLANCDPAQRAIGADGLWQAWIGRKQYELNMQLAQVLAVKERHIAQVREAFGKVLVTDALLDSASIELKKKKARARLERAIESTQ